MHKYLKLVTALLIVINILNYTPSIAEDLSKPYTITATIYNKESTEYGITFRSMEKFNKPQVQVAKKVNGNQTLSDPKVFVAVIDNYGSQEKDNIYKAVVSGLEYDTEYVYRVGDQERNIWSEVCSFRTAPHASSTSVFTFLYVTDTQRAPTRFGEVLKKAFSMNPDIRFILHTGDMVDNGLREREWKCMLHDNRKYTAHILINSISGNVHEDNGAELYNHFHKELPNNQAVEKGYFYSFDYGNAHFLMLDITDADRDFKLSKQQIDWIKADLASTDKTWRIACLHWPLYSTGPHSNYGVERFENLRQQLEPLFSQYNVDLVLNGHDHVYSRTKSILDGLVYEVNDYTEKKHEGVRYTSVVNQKGTTYLTGGSSGNKFYDSHVPGRFYDYFEVHTELSNSTFAIITIGERDLVVKAYIYDHIKDKAVLHDAFGFTRISTRQQYISTSVMVATSLMILLKNFIVNNKRRRRSMNM